MQRPLDTSTSIETPERVDFEFRLAGPTRRAAAWILDALVRAIVIFGLAIALLAGGAISGIDQAATGMLLIVGFVLEWGYFVLFELLMEGRTPGKKALRLRVVREDGTSVRFGDSVLRNLLRAADILPTGYALGVLVASLDPKFRRLGDLAAGTIVIVEERSRIPALPRLRDAPELDALPAVPVSAAELSALETFVSRLPTIHPARANDLAAILANGFAKRIGVAPPRDAARFLLAVYQQSRGTPRPSEASQP